MRGNAEFETIDVIKDTEESLMAMKLDFCSLITILVPHPIVEYFLTKQSLIESTNHKHIVLHGCYMNRKYLVIGQSVGRKTLEYDAVIEDHVYLSDLMIRLA